MPPKGSRGGRGGRGRGRGKASGANTTPLGIRDPGEPESQSTQTLSPSPLPSPTKITTPTAKDTDEIEDKDGDVEMNLSPNSSPATVPTETPAPTPVRAPLSRQDSTNNGEAGGRSYGLSGRGSGDARGSTAVGVRGGATVDAGAVLGGRVRGSQKESKFKPRNIRRDAGEREKADKEEKERLAAIAAAAAKMEIRGRGRGVRGGRGRGDVMGRGLGLGRGSGGTAANGPFGIAPAATERRPGSIVPASITKREGGISRSGGGGGRTGESSATSKSRIKTEGSFFEHSANSISEDRPIVEDHKDIFRGPQYPDEDNSTPRVDIEYINLISSDEDDTPMITGTNRINKGKSIASNKGGLKPVRLHREEHKERVSQVNTESSNLFPGNARNSDEGIKAVDEQRSSRIPHSAPNPWKDVYQDSTPVQVKTEPDLIIPSEPDLSFAMHSRSTSRDRTPAVQPPAIAPRSLESRRATKELTAEVGPVSPEQKKKPGRHGKRRDLKPVIQTEEDRAEYERHLEDVAILANELGGLQTRIRDPEGDVAMEGDGDLESDKKEGRLYLFQFPPVLPRLYNPLNPREQPPQKEDVEMTGSSAYMDLTKEKESGMKIKVEEEVIIKKEDVEGDGKEKEVRPARKVIVDEEGFIGKLIVRESGKVELGWGGTSMVLGRGVDTGFLSMGVVVDGETGQVMDKEGEGKAMGMGKVMGKFVVVPDWEKMS